MLGTWWGKRLTEANIIIADDCPSDIMIARDVLRRSSISNDITEVSECEDIVGLLSQPGEHMILLDMNMPRMEGLEIVEAIRANDMAKNATIIAVSGLVDIRQMERAQELGVVAWIEKPLTFDKIKYVIDKLPELSWSIKKKRVNKVA